MKGWASSPTVFTPHETKKLMHCNAYLASQTTIETGHNTHLPVVTNRLSDFLGDPILLPEAIALDVRVRPLLGGFVGLLRLFGNHCL